MDHSLAWELLKFLKILVAFLTIFCVLELGVIGYMGYLLYDSRFEYTETKTQELEDVNNTTASIE